MQLGGTLGSSSCDNRPIQRLHQPWVIQHVFFYEQGDAGRTVMNAARAIRVTPRPTANLFDLENEKLANIMRHVVYIIPSSSRSCIGSGSSD